MKILITESENYSERALEIYRQAGYVVLGNNLTREELLREVSNADILVSRLAHVIDREILERAKNLRFIASPTTGLNHIDIKSAENRGIKVISLRGETEFLRKVHATSEHTFALLLALIRKVPWNFNAVIQDRSWDRDSFKGRELSGKILGIIGVGRLGSHVAKIARGFDMNVLGCDPHVSKFEIEAGGVVPVELDYLLEYSDIISIHVSLVDKTKNFIDARIIAKMKDGVLLVNTSRGEIVDEIALLSALESGKIGGAAFDVLADELHWSENKKIAEGNASLKLIEYAQSHGNLLITSHLGGATYESMEKTEIFIAQKVKSYLHEKTSQSFPAN